MKYTQIAVIAAMLMVSTTQAIKIEGKGAVVQRQKGMDDDLDDLMQKYDTSENKSVKSSKSSDSSQKSGSGGPNKSDVQDMELKILSGNMLATSSDKAADDDLYNEVLDKYETASKKDKDSKILTKDQALDASAEVLGQKMGLDTYDAMDKVKKSFA